MSVTYISELKKGQSKMGPTPLGMLVRFWNRVARGSVKECWWWNGNPNSSGYGRIYVGARGHGKLWQAHRLSFLIHNGSIREDLEVCHSCDQKMCVNPHHLFQGTHQENFDDAVAKNLMPFGERHSQARFSDERIRQIRERYAGGDVTIASLASEYGFSKGYGSQIMTGAKRARG